MTFFPRHVLRRRFHCRCGGSAAVERAQNGGLQPPTGSAARWVLATPHRSRLLEWIGITRVCAGKGGGASVRHACSQTHVHEHADGHGGHCMEAGRGEKDVIRDILWSKGRWGGCWRCTYGRRRHKSPFLIQTHRNHFREAACGAVLRCFQAWRSSWLMSGDAPTTQIRPAGIQPTENQ